MWAQWEPQFNDLVHPKNFECLFEIDWAVWEKKKRKAQQIKQTSLDKQPLPPNLNRGVLQGC